MEPAHSEKNGDLTDIIKFEIRSVRANIVLDAADKNEKIKQLKLLVPKCKDWEGLDEPIQERTKWI
jgi:hypothetical protein